MSQLQTSVSVWISTFVNDSWRCFSSYFQYIGITLLKTSFDIYYSFSLGFLLSYNSLQFFISSLNGKKFNPRQWDMSKTFNVFPCCIIELMNWELRLNWHRPSLFSLWQLFIKSINSSWLLSSNVWSCITWQWDNLRQLTLLLGRLLFFCCFFII